MVFLNIALVCQGVAQSPMSLANAETMALANRPSIQAAIEKVAAARDKERAASVSPPLRLEFGDGTRPELGIGNDLLLAVPVDLFGKSGAQRASAHADYLSARATMIQEATDLQTEVFTAYSALLSAQALVDSSQEQVVLEQKSYDATKKRIATGDLPPSQLLRADLELRKAQQLLEVRTHMLESAKKTLATDLGVEVASLGAPAAETLTLPELAKVEQRPDIAAAIAAIDAAKAEKRIASTSSTPDLEFQLAHDYFDSSGHLTARAQFVWNFFDFGASRNRHSAGEHDRKAASLNVKDLEALAKTQIEVAKSDYESAQKESNSYEGLVKDSQTLLEKEQRAFDLGASSLLDVIDAARSLREIQESAVDAKARSIVAGAKYLAASGILLGTLPKGAER